MLKKFKDVRQWYSRKSTKEFDEDLAPQVREIIVKFKETKIYQTDTWTWKLLHEYLVWQQLGVRYQKQRKKIVEAILKYGKNSLFWEELKASKMQRKTDWIRVAYLCYLLTTTKDILKGTQSRKGKLTVFMKQAIDYRKKLLVEPLTEKQRSFMWECERILGVYYEDLSYEDNGEIWRLEAEKLEEKEV